MNFILTAVFKDSRLSIAAILTLLSIATSARASDLAELSSGQRIESQALLNDQQVLVYIEHDCAPCAKLVSNLKGCSEEVKKKVRLISISSPSKTRDFITKTKTEFPVYLSLREKKLRATPTIQLGSAKLIGMVSCKKLSELID